jgi:cytochrome c
MRRMASTFFGWVLASSVAVSAPPAFAGNEAGELVFKENCARCHSLRPGVSTKGPSLHGVIGRKAGSLPGYDYSSALRDADFEWTVEKLDEWLSSPHKAVKGTEMSFLGIADPGKRAAVIALLKSWKAE